MKDPMNVDVCKWADDIQNRLKIWKAIGDEEHIEKCEELLQGWYVFTMDSNPITNTARLTIFNSKINSKIDIKRCANIEPKTLEL